MSVADTTIAPPHAAAAGAAIAHDPGAAAGRAPGANSAPFAAARVAFTVDVEEYFHAEAFHGCLEPADWPRLERRAAPRLERIGALLRDCGRRATFFVLGWTVEYLKRPLRDLAAAGHEIAAHGYSHAHLSRLTPQLLREDLRRCRGVIEDVLGVRPRGYRAPTFSITRRTAWALDVIIAEDFDYDASIFPVRHDRYGIPDAPLTPFWALGPSGARILEFPPLTLASGFLRVPVGGGGYLRLLPGGILRHFVRRRIAVGDPVLLYVHPWELDPAQPRLPIGPLGQWRQRVNLHTTEGKIARLLEEFDVAPAGHVLDALVRARPLPHFSVGT